MVAKQHEQRARIDPPTAVNGAEPAKEAARRAALGRWNGKGIRGVGKGLEPVAWVGITQVVGSDTLNASYPAVADAVPAARKLVADFAARAGVARERLDAVRLAVSEAVTN